MTSFYQIWIKNQEGERVAVLTDDRSILRSLYLTHLENYAGTLRMEIDGRSSLIPLLQTDGFIEVYRRVKMRGLSIDWYREWEGLLVGEERLINQAGDKSYVVHAAGYLDLAYREEIAYYSNTAFGKKSGTGETVIKAFARENIGPDADHASRFYNGEKYGLSIEGDFLRGSTWSGERSQKNLGEVIRGIAVQTGLAIDIVGTGPAAFEFRVYKDQRGKDRTNIGLVQATGKNAAGYVPVIFSDKLRNMKNAHYSFHHGSEANTILALGPGEDSGRQITIRQNASGVTASRLNRRALSINASQQKDAAERESSGDAALVEYAPRETFTFEPIQRSNQAYGQSDDPVNRDRLYWWGDKVTGRIDDIERHKRLIGVKITFNENGEKIDHDFADVTGY